MATAIWHKARRWEQRTHQKKKHGGILGRAGLAVLYSLLNDFHNFRTGRLDPSIKSLAEKASVSARTAHTALARLRTLGIVAWIRRCRHSRDADNKFILQQDTNAYQIAASSQWGPAEPPPPPPPHPDTIGTPKPYPDAIDSARLDIETGDRRRIYGDLASDPNDRLAIALAQLGRAMGAI